MPIHKAAMVSLIEQGHTYWTKTILRALKSGAAPGGKMNRTAMNQFQKALIEAGRLADAVSALLREVGVDTVEQLKEIVAAYRQAQRVTEEDNLEIACLTIDAHLGKVPEDREQLVRRFGGVIRGDDEKPVA